MAVTGETHLPTCIVVDDDDVLRNRLAKALVARGLQVRTADGVDAAISLIAAEPPRYAVIDLKMSGASGLDLLRHLQSASPATRSVLLTGYGSITNAVEAMKLGAVNYVAKPADADQVYAALMSDAATPESGSFQPPSLAEAEWEHIHRVLAECGGNISKAALLLDIPRRTLQRKLKKLAP